MPRPTRSAAPWFGAVALCVLAGAPRASLAQTAPAPSAPSRVTLSGVAWDSLSAEPLVGALVQFADENNPSAGARTAVSDSLGRWRIDSIPAGNYLGGYFHPTLDALGLEPPTFRLVLQADSAATLDFGIPGPERLRELLCGKTTAGDSTGGIVGVLRDADREEAIDGATLSVTWRELVLARGRVSNELHRVPVVARRSGTFLACGVPTDTPVELDAAAPGRASGVIEVQVPSRALLRRDLSLGDSATVTQVLRAAREPAVAADSAADSSPRALRVPDGATLRGVVTGPDGKPLARAQVAVAGTGRLVTTGVAGTFLLDSLPSGTFGVEARAVGLTPVRRAVDLGRGRSTSVTLALAERATALSTVTILGERSRTSRFLEEFAERRRRSAGGNFLGPADLERRPLLYVSDALRMTPGLRVQPGRGFGYVVRGRGNCTPAVFLDGMAISNGADDLDQIVPPNQVLAIESYSAATAPPQYSGLSANGCGAIVVWTKR